MSSDLNLRRYIQSRVVVSVDGCWLWQLRVDKDGYGYAHVQGRNRRAHRLSYETYRGPIPEGMVIDHLCRVRSCLNPAHFEVVSPQENTDRGLLHLFRGVRERAKTHCPKGHEYTEQNTIVRARGRACRTCALAVGRATTAKARQRGPEFAPADSHGKKNTYVYYRCRCDPCRLAQNAYQVECRRRRRSASKPPDTTMPSLRERPLRPGP